VTFPGRAHHDIALQGAAVFVMPISKLKPFLHAVDTPDWILRPRGLLDFQEQPPELGTARIAFQIVTGIGNAAAGDVRALIPPICKLMYCSKDFADVARGAMVRIIAGDPSAIAAWADSLQNLIVNGSEIIWE
jgi:hypothetical protein